MNRKNKRVSLVIPAYNEENHIKACLDCIATQTIRPFEVIVINNNSTDNTAEIAKSYDFVRLINEPKRGVVYARDAGFNAANGEIIGRIDADSHLPPDWIANVLQILNDRKIDAVSGSIHYYDQVFWKAGDAIDNFCRKQLSRQLLRSRTVFLQGANLAIRRSAWQAVKDEVCHQNGLHEDFDLAIHLQQNGYRVDFNTNLRAGISSRRADSDIISFVRYLLVCPRTYEAHRLRSRVYMYPVGLVWLIIYLPSLVGYRGFDESTGHFSLERLLSQHPLNPRLDPSTTYLND